LVQFAGHTIKFDIKSPELLSLIDTHFAHCLGGDENLVAEYQVQAGVEPLPDGQAQFSISKDGAELAANIDLEGVLFQLMQDGLTQLNGASSTHMVFHAAGLALDERGLILCGKSGSGKSTLTTSLVSNGFQYLTDEVIASPLEGGPVSGFARSLVLKKGSAFLWQDWPAQKIGAGFFEFKNGNAWVAPTLLNASAVCKSVTPRLLLFPTYKAGAELKAELLSPANTLFNLLQMLVNARNLPEHGMNAASQFARQITAYRLTYSNLEDANAWIRQTLNTL
jgi:hypothetical protein